MINHSLVEMQKKMPTMEQRLATAALERKCMEAKIETLESKNKTGEQKRAEGARGGGVGNGEG